MSLTIEISFSCGACHQRIIMYWCFCLQFGTTCVGRVASFLQSQHGCRAGSSDRSTSYRHSGRAASHGN